MGSLPLTEADMSCGNSPKPEMGGPGIPHCSVRESVQKCLRRRSLPK
jgi:hypothetical protein